MKDKRKAYEEKLDALADAGPKTSLRNMRKALLGIGDVNNTGDIQRKKCK